MRVEDVHLDQQIFVLSVIVHVPEQLGACGIVPGRLPDSAQELGLKGDGDSLIEHELITDDEAHSRLAVRGRGGQLSVIGPDLDLIPCSDRP